METVLMLGIPCSVLAVVAVGGYEVIQKRRGKRSGTPLAGTYVEEVTALLNGNKRAELDHRDSMSMMRDDEAQGGPPNTGVDLDRGVVVLEPGERPDQVNREGHP